MKEKTTAFKKPSNDSHGKATEKQEKMWEVTDPAAATDLPKEAARASAALAEAMKLVHHVKDVIFLIAKNTTKHVPDDSRQILQIRCCATLSIT